MQFGTRATSTTNVALKRPASSTLQLVETRYGGALSPVGTTTTVVLRGVTFVASKWARCVLLLSDRTVHAELAPVSFINSTAVVCTVPGTAAPTPLRSVIAYSHDGSVFGASTLPFAIVGEASGLAIMSPASGTAVVSTSRTHVPEVSVHVVDAYGNSLLSFDKSKRVIRCEAAVGDSSALDTANGTNVATSGYGIALFSSLYLSRPRSGTVSLSFEHASGATQWLADLTLVVLVGAPTGIALLNANSSSVWIVGTRAARQLIPPPEAGVVDPAGNLVVDAALLPLTLTLYTEVAEYVEGVGYVERQRALPAMCAKGTGLYTFADVSMRATFGMKCVLRILSSTAGISEFVSNPLTMETCMAGVEYGAAGTFQCKRCPRHGVCDGTSNVKCQPGFWRADRSSLTFYDCSPPYADRSCLDGECKPGYRGPRCSVCEAGYGKTGLQCSRCGNSVANWVLIVLVVLVVCVVVAFLVNNSIRAGANSSGKPKVVSLIFKQLLTHLQIVALAEFSADEMPSFLKDYFRYHGTASSISPDVFFIACELTQDFYRHFVLVVAMPAFFVVTFAIVSAVQTYVVHRLETAPADTDEELRLAAYREEVLNRCECHGIAVSAISTSWNSPLGASAPPNAPHDRYSDIPQGTEHPLRQPKRSTFVGIAGRTSVASANESAAASPLCTSGDTNTSKPAGPCHIRRARVGSVVC